MKKIIYLFVFCAVVFMTSGGSAPQSDRKLAMYGVAFYNLENLFDTIHAPGKNDFEYLPDGANKWNSLKYHSKLSNLSIVLSELCTDKVKAGAALIGISEIENRTVVEDLLKQPALKDRGFKILHFESPDRRGVDCGLLYNPRFFTLEDSLYVPYIYLTKENPDENLMGFTYDDKSREINVLPLYGDTTHITRGFMVGIGKLAGERLAVIVNHWPSRFAASPARERAARQVKKLCDTLMKKYDNDLKIIVMGDLNDDPDDPSLSKGMQCKYEAGDLKNAGDFFNPWKFMLRTKGRGTLMYDGKWNLFDQIIFTGNCVNKDCDLRHAPKVAEMDLSKGLTFYQNVIFVRDYLFNQEGRDKGAPKRTHSRGVWLNGYSDHLPTQVYFVKEIINKK